MVNSKICIITISIFLLGFSSLKAQLQLEISNSFRTVTIKQKTKVSYFDLNDAEKVKTDRLIRITKDSFLILEKDTVAFNDFILIRKNPFLNLLALSGASVTTSFGAGATAIIFFLESYGAALCDDDCNIPIWQTHPNTLLAGSFTMINSLIVYRGINRLQKPKTKEDWEYKIVFVKNPQRFKSKSSYWFWQNAT
ncbi:MAG: hypothetical protein ACPGLV_18635 [Bacteroidia bacterium]